MVDNKPLILVVESSKLRRIGVAQPEDRVKPGQVRPRHRPQRLFVADKPVNHVVRLRFDTPMGLFRRD